MFLSLEGFVKKTRRVQEILCDTDVFAGMVFSCHAAWTRVSEVNPDVSLLCILKGLLMGSLRRFKSI